MGLGLSKDADNPNPSDSDSCTGSGTYVKKKYAITMSTVTYSKDIALLMVVHVLFIMIYLNHTVYDYLLEFVHVIIRGPNSCLTCKGNCSSWYISI